MCSTELLEMGIIGTPILNYGLTFTLCGQPNTSCWPHVWPCLNLLGRQIKSFLFILHFLNWRMKWIPLKVERCEFTHTFLGIVIIITITYYYMKKTTILETLYIVDKDKDPRFANIHVNEQGNRPSTCPAIQCLQPCGDLVRAPERPLASTIQPNRAGVLTHRNCEIKLPAVFIC